MRRTRTALSRAFIRVLCFRSLRFLLLSGSRVSLLLPPASLSVWLSLTFPSPLFLHICIYSPSFLLSSPSPIHSRPPCIPSSLPLLWSFSLPPSLPASTLTPPSLSPSPSLLPPSLLLPHPSLRLPFSLISLPSLSTSHVSVSNRLHIQLL